MPSRVASGYCCTDVVTDQVMPSRVASGYCCTDVVTDQDKLRLTANLPSCLPSPSSEKVFPWKTLLISIVEVAISNSDPYKNYPESFRGFSQSSHNIPGKNHKLSCDGIPSISFPSITSYYTAITSYYTAIASYYTAITSYYTAIQRCF